MPFSLPSETQARVLHRPLLLTAGKLHTGLLHQPTAESMRRKQTDGQPQVPPLWIHPGLLAARTERGYSARMAPSLST